MPNLKQLKCPNCGAIVALSSPYERFLECPYCHQQVVNEPVVGSQKDASPRILPFSLNEDQVMRNVVKEFMKCDFVPYDVFEEMKNVSLRKCYIPLYVYVYRDSDGLYYRYEVPMEIIKDLYLDGCGIDRLHINPVSLPLLTSEYMSQTSDVAFYPVKDDLDIAMKVGTDEIHADSWYVVYIPLWVIDYEYIDETYRLTYYAEQVFAELDSQNYGREFAVPYLDKKDWVENTVMAENGSDFYRDENRTRLRRQVISLIGWSIIIVALVSLVLYPQNIYGGWLFVVGLWYWGIVWTIRILWAIFSGGESKTERQKQAKKAEKADFYADHKERTGKAFLKRKKWIVKRQK